MKTKIYLLAALLAVVFTSCNRDEIGNASFIEGAWELRTSQSDKIVYYDLSGNTHMIDSACTSVYDSKDRVWLFYQNNISEWSYFVYDGHGEWDGYFCDCYRNYVTSGEGSNLEIVETTGSIIPGMEDAKTIKHYKVLKLTNQQMILSFTEPVYVTDSLRTIDVHLVYTFQRENTLLEYIRSVYPE